MNTFINAQTGKKINVLQRKVESKDFTAMNHAEFIASSKGIVIEVLPEDLGELCPKYNAQVLPDDNGKCSLCGEHDAN